MARLIDAENLDFVSYQGVPNGYKGSFDSGILYAMNLIDEQPTIDAVPVVRCKDCKHSWYDEIFGMRWCNGRKCNDDWFCADGEKEKV